MEKKKKQPSNKFGYEHEPSKATKEDSMTIPGQAFTNREIVEKLQGGNIIVDSLSRDYAYSGDEMVNDANSVDIVDVMQKKQAMDKEVALLEQNKKTKALAEQKKKEREQIIAEYEKLKAENDQTISAEKNE